MLGIRAKQWLLAAGAFIFGGLLWWQGPGVGLQLVQWGHDWRWWDQPEIIQLDPDPALAAELALLQAEKADLVAALGFSELEERELLGVNVVEKTRSGQQLIYLIDRGRDDGVRENQALVNEVGAILGKVIRVEAGHAFVLHVNSPPFTLQVIQPDTGFTGVVQYSTAAGLEFQYYSPDPLELKPGMSIWSGGDNLGFPDGLWLGTVREVIDDPVQALTRAYIDPAVAIDYATYAYLVTD